MCCLLVVYSPLGLDNVSRHSLTRPGRYSARVAYLQPALRSASGAFDTVEATIRVTEPPPYRRALGLSRSRRARTEGAGADDFRVYTHDPRHVAAAAVVPWNHCGSDGNGAVRVDGHGGPRKERTVPESNRVCVI